LQWLKEFSEDYILEISTKIPEDIRKDIYPENIDIHFGVGASGYKVVDDTTKGQFREYMEYWSSLQNLDNKDDISRDTNKIQSVEMEGAGFMEAIRNLHEDGYQSKAIMIRGISDKPKTEIDKIESGTDVRDHMKKTSPFIVANFVINFIKDFMPDKPINPSVPLLESMIEDFVLEEKPLKNDINPNIEEIIENKIIANEDLDESEMEAVFSELFYQGIVIKCENNNRTDHNNCLVFLWAKCIWSSYEYLSRQFLRNTDLNFRLIPIHEYTHEIDQSISIKDLLDIRDLSKTTRFGIEAFIKSKRDRFSTLRINERFSGSFTSKWGSTAKIPELYDLFYLHNDLISLVPANFHPNKPLAPFEFYPIEKECSICYKECLLGDRPVQWIEKYSNIDPNNSIIAFGSQKANMISRRFLGNPYVKTPVFSLDDDQKNYYGWNTIFHWNFFDLCDNQTSTINQYGIDWESGHHQFVPSGKSGEKYESTYSTNANNIELQDNDFLLITSIPRNVKYRNRIIIFEGLHGAGTKAAKLLFSYPNIKLLRNIQVAINSNRFFQALLHVDVGYPNGDNNEAEPSKLQLIDAKPLLIDFQQ